MKKHNLFKVVMITLAIAVLLSWALPVTYFSQNGGLIEEARDQIGIFEVMSYVGIAIQYFSHIGIYVLIVGGLYGVLHKTSGYRNLLDKMVKEFKGREWIFMSVVMVIFAVLSSMAGLSLPLIVMFPFVIAVLLAMGYDKITAAMVTAGSVAVGLIGSVFSVNNTYGIDAVIGTSPDGDVWLKIMLLVIGLALLIFNVMVYAKRHRDTKNLVSGSYIPEASTKKNEKIWPIVVIMDIVFVVLILAFFSWDLFEITWFRDALKAVTVDYTIGDFKPFGSLLGLNNPFGQWTLVEGSVVLLLASWLISFVYKIKFSDYITYFMNGAKRALKPAVLVILVYMVLITTTYVPTLLTIFKPMLELTNNVNAFIMSIVAFVSSIFSVELYYAGTGVLPYVVNALYTGVEIDVTLLSLIWQSMYGVAMLVAPTSVVLIATLSYLHIPYGKWLKAIMKLFLELVGVLLAIFVIMAFI